jgi:hypothetical protein
MAQHAGKELMIDDETLSWQLAGEQISVLDAITVAGEENADYVKTRTRAEVAWLWVLAEWCEDRANALSRDLDGALAR